MRLAIQTFADYHFISAKKSTSIEQAKLLIVLHGRGDSLTPFKNFDVELSTPNLNYLLLNGTRRIGRDAFAWCGLKTPENGLRTTRAKLKDLLEELIAKGFRAKNIFILGFSEGCLAAADFVMNYPRPLGGVIGVSGCLHLAKNWRTQLSRSARQTPWLFTHGLRDRVIRIESMRERTYQLRASGLDIDWVELNKKHEIENDLELPLIDGWIRAKSRQTRPDLASL